MASTYSAELSRPAASVGRLVRLAIVLPAIHVEEHPEAPAMELREAAARALQAELAAYLRERKGYDTVLVESHSAARDVDGIVVTERWIPKPWSFGKGLGNLLLLNIPLFNALSAVHLRITIEEAASGKVVWRGELKGQLEATRGETTSLDYGVDLHAVLADLDNAVPAILRK